MLSPDRKRILSQNQNGEYALYPVDGGAALPAKGIQETDYLAGWSDDSRSVYVRPNRGGHVEMPVSVVDLTTGIRTAWKTFHPSQQALEVGGLRIAPNGAYAYNYYVVTSDLFIARGLVN